MEVISFVRIFNFIKPDNDIFILIDKDEEYLLYKTCKKREFLLIPEWNYVEMIPYSKYQYSKKRAETLKTTEPFVVGYDKKEKEIFILKKPSENYPIYNNFLEKLPKIQNTIKSLTLADIELDENKRNFLIDIGLKYILNEGLLTFKLVQELSRKLYTGNDDIAVSVIKNKLMKNQTKQDDNSESECEDFAE